MISVMQRLDESVTPPLRSLNRRVFSAVHVTAAAALVLALGWFEIYDVDLGYHVAYGRHFFAAGRIVEVDPFIYGATDHRFINANWLSQIALAWLFDRFGSGGVIGLRLVLIGVVFAGIALCVREMLARTPARPDAGHWIAWAWLAAALGSYERFNMRPELFSYAILAVQLWLLVRYDARDANVAARRPWWTLAGIAATQIFWVNLHSYFLLGPILTLCFLAGAAVRGRAAGAMSRARQLGLILAVQVLACLVNPWHVRGAAFPLATLSYLRSADAMARSPDDPGAAAWGVIAEFMSPFGFIGFHGARWTILAYLVLLGLAGMGFLALLWRRHFGAALVIVAMALLSTQMRRNIPLLALSGAPLAVAGLAAFPMRGLRRTWVAVPAGLTVIAAAVALVGVWSGRFYFLERRPERSLSAGMSDAAFPRAALEWINGHAPLRPRLFADLMTCSNALLWMRPPMQVYVTTNTFAYPPERLARVWDVGLARVRHAAFFDEQGVNIVLLRAWDATRPLIGNLAADPAWALVSFDRAYVLFIRRIPAHADIIAAEARTADHLDVVKWIADSPRPHAVTAMRLASAANVPFCLGWFDRARPLLAEAVRQEPSFHDAWLNLGICRVMAGKAARSAGRLDEALAEFKSGLTCFENVTRLIASSREALVNAALAHEDMALAMLAAQSPAADIDREFEDAIRAAERATALAPRVSGLWKTLGVRHYNYAAMLQQAGRSSEAAAEFNRARGMFAKALECDPQDAESQKRLDGAASSARNCVAVQQSD